MNIRDVNTMVAGLIDEETIDEYSNKIRGYYDAAQKQIATTVDFVNAEFEMNIGEPAEIDIEKYIKINFSKRIYKLCKILSDKAPTRVFGLKYNFSPGMYRIFCYVYPEDITNSTPEDYEFEVSPEAQPAIAYYAAAKCVVTDSDQRPYYAFMDGYNNILQNINDSRNKNTSINIVKIGGQNNGI